MIFGSSWQVAIFLCATIIKIGTTPSPQYRNSEVPLGVQQPYYGNGGNGYQTSPGYNGGVYPGISSSNYNSPYGNSYGGGLFGNQGLNHNGYGYWSAASTNRFTLGSGARLRNLSAFSLATTLAILLF